MSDEQPAVFDPAAIALRHRRLVERIIDAGGDPAVVKILAVSKALPPDAAVAAVEAGLLDLGEREIEIVVVELQEFGKVLRAARDVLSRIKSIV